jgi:hypothetical protein
MRTAMRRAVRRSARFVLAEERLENFPEGASPAQDARFHRANAALENFGDLLVTQAFEVPQDDGGAKHVWNILQSVLHGNLNLSRSKLFKRCGAQILNFKRDVALLRLRVD